ncbi:hypothetical protein SELMODRAFT_110876 [Selaginella moellendorffii]|uniref:Pentacotripeptide-repeat region of PRORP domain-containing protein n=1 Tax=Selaginella moellendorffii TaxID=88036 RepID=D8S804_SELML|nr:hypothetical protein SELMODRAFT_110876 [Selaginella moellendorffii]
MPDRNAVSWTIMLTVYARNQRFDEAMEFLDAMPDRNAVSWNVMIAAFGHSGDGNLDMPIEIFRMMLLDGVPPMIGTFVTIFGVLGLLMDVKLGSEIHGLILERGLGANLHVMNAVLRMYTACQSLEDCERTLESMEARDTVTWSLMITAYSRDGDIGRAVRVFQEMVEGFLPDDSTFLSVLPRKSPEECGKILALMVESFNIEPRLEHYACLADSLRYAGDAKDAQEVLRRCQVRQP